MIDPRFLSATRWAAETGADLARHNVGNIPILIREDNWRDWARFVVSLPLVAAFSPPNPDRFPHWQGWALKFNETIAVLT